MIIKINKFKLFKINKDMNKLIIKISKPFKN